MIAADENAEALQLSYRVTNANRTLPEEVSKITLADWNDSAADYICSELFAMKQFVDDEELTMGGQIEQLVCVKIHISGLDRARIYWDERGGKETVRETFRCKRQAAQNAMKLAFAGKPRISSVVC